MKNWNQAVNKYKLESGNFDNYDGPLYQNNFMGQAKSFIGEAHNADGNAGTMGGDIFSNLSDGNKFYTIVVQNTQTTGAAITAVVFGANQYSGSTQPNANVTVTVQESSHAEARAESVMSPFWVNGFRYRTTTSSQMNGQVLTFQKRTSTGEIQQYIFRPLSQFTSYQQQSLQVDAVGYKFLVDGNFSIQVPVIAAETVTLILQLGGRFQPQNIVAGQSSLAVANQSPLQTGLVQVVK
jgi:hypothetical protein